MSSECTNLEILLCFRILFNRFASAILGPIARASIIAMDHETLLVQPTNSSLRALPRVRSTVNGLSGYPR